MKILFLFIKTRCVEIVLADVEEDLSDKELEARSIAFTSASKLLFDEKIDVGMS